MAKGRRNKGNATRGVSATLQDIWQQSLRLGINLLLYLRSSSDEQTFSCDRQAGDLAGHLRDGGILDPGDELPATHRPDQGVYVDDGISGWKCALDERPGSKELLEFCLANPQPEEKPGIIFVWALSRLGRFPGGAEEAIYWIYSLRRSGWRVSSLTQPELHAGDAGDRLLRVIRAALESEKDTASSVEKSDLVASGKQWAIKTGVWPGGSAPFGFERWAVSLTDGARAVGEWIEPLPGTKRNGYRDAKTVLRPGELAEWVVRMYLWFADGEHGRRLSLCEIARRLHQAGVPLSRNGKAWTHRSVTKILTNEAYIAIQRDDEENPHRALWEPLVPRDLWDRVQARLAKDPPRGRSANSEFPLSGLVYCKACGVVFWGERAKSGNGYQRYYRAAKDELGTRDCPSCQVRIPAEALEEPVLQAIPAIADHSVVLGAVRDEQDALTGDKGTLVRRIEEIDREMSEITERVRRYVDRLGETDGFVAEQIQEKLQILNAAARRLQMEREKLEASRCGEAVVAAHVEAARGFHRVYRLASPAEQKDLMRMFICRIEVDATCSQGRVTYRSP